MEERNSKMNSIDRLKLLEISDNLQSYLDSLNGKNFDKLQLKTLNQRINKINSFLATIDSVLGKLYLNPKPGGGIHLGELTQLEFNTVQDTYNLAFLIRGNLQGAKLK